MADDIVGQLRVAGESASVTFADWSVLFHNAADEIERLRAELSKTRLNHLTTLGELMEATKEVNRG